MVKGFCNCSIVEWFMVLKSQPLPLSEWLKSYLWFQWNDLWFIKYLMVNLFSIVWNLVNLPFCFCFSSMQWLGGYGFLINNVFTSSIHNVSLYYLLQPLSPESPHLNGKAREGQTAETTDNFLPWHTQGSESESNKKPLSLLTLSKFT